MNEPYSEQNMFSFFLKKHFNFFVSSCIQRFLQHIFLWFSLNSHQDTAAPVILGRSLTLISCYLM